MEVLYKRLRDIREDKDLTQSDIAKILNTSQGYYSKYELGKRELPLHHLKTLCKFYDITADYFLGLTKEPSHLPRR